MMPADSVLALLAGLAEAGLGVWLDGGWGVDALLGEQHRPHDDADLVIELAQVPRLVDYTASLGYAVSEDFLPTRLVLRAPGRQIDVHPLTFDEIGNGWQAQANPDGTDCYYPADGFTTGRIHGTVVPCLGPEVQVAHHLGYLPGHKTVTTWPESPRRSA